MFGRLADLFAAPETGATPIEAHVDDVQFAAAALMVEAALTDGDFAVVEQQRIAELLAWRFDISDQAATGLVGETETLMRTRVDFHAFSNTLLTDFTPTERLQMIELLWEVVYADGHVDEMEQHLMRRITGLLQVPDQQAGAARKRVADRNAPPAASGD